MGSSNSIWAIVVAGGQGLRFGTQEPKQFLPMAGRPLFEYSLNCLSQLPEIEGIILVFPQAYYTAYQKSWHGRLTVVAGGKLRQDSVLQGLAAIPVTAKWILIHDAARPLVDEFIVKETLKAAQSTGAAVAATPIADTLKKADNEGYVKNTVNRQGLYQSQTPQVFRRDLLEQGFAYAKANRLEVTDEAALMESIGVKVRLASGSPRNFKITTLLDFELAEQLILGQRKKVL
ncbi:MAG: 2-C-methyl-D-erythritol 4-phosphate cytidylyltransferase [Deltaproteobacteria bacterium]|nr:2-C-methyl-D-erythritol 4-phosphate cytidylyltransferase [Deltaproteobacteria bacterium]